MDALKLLKEDHDHAKELFAQIEDAEGKEAQALFEELMDALRLHEEMEEKQLYPQLKKDPNAKDLVLESYQEHHVMDVLMEELSKLRPSSEAWKPKVTVLQENTEHHIEEEEG